MSERVTVAARKAGGVERVTVMWRRGQRVTVAARKQGSGQYVVATLRSGGSQGRRACAAGVGRDLLPHTRRRMS